MKRLILTVTALSLAGALAACAKKEAATETAAAPAAAPAATTSATTPPAATAASGDMAAMGMTADAKMAKGTGKVTAVDAKAGTITLDHGPIPEANWPAMTMTFKAAPTITQAVKVGDKVAFELKLQGGGAEVAAIQKQ